MKVCAKCGKNKNDSEFSIQTGLNKDGTRHRKERISSWCKACSSKRTSESNKRIRTADPEYIRAKDRLYYDKNRARKNEQMRTSARLFKKKCIEYLGGACNVCGYIKCVAALDFHHRDPKTKEFDVSRAGRSFTDRIRKELDKCDILCSNCHKELHYEQDLSLEAV